MLVTGTAHLTVDVLTVLCCGVHNVDDDDDVDYGAIALFIITLFLAKL